VNREVMEMDVISTCEPHPLTALFRLLLPPLFADGEQGRQARKVIWIQGLLSLVAALILVFLPVANPDHHLRLALISGYILGFSGGIFYLTRWGQLGAASWTVVLQLLILIALATWTSGGMEGQAIWFSVVVVAVAGFLLSTRAGLITLGLCLLLDVGLLLAETWSVLPPSRVQYGPLGHLGWNAVLLIMASGLQSLASRCMQTSLDEANQELAMRRASEQELKLHKEQLEETVANRTAELSQFKTAVENCATAIVITDREGAIEYVNPRFCRRTGYSQDEVLGKNPRILSSGAHPPEYYEELWRTLLSGREWHGEFQNRSKGGERLWELSSISPLYGDDGEITHFVAAKEDITEHKKLQEKLTRMAHYDELTGLPNRALFFDRLEQVLELSRRKERSFCVLFIDLDGFKGVNDTHGHDAGDELLVEVGRRLRGLIRASDTVARLGGDEFTLILTDLQDRAEAKQVARRIREAISEPMKLAGSICQVGASIGVASFPRDGQDSDQLVSSADSAMYRAKHGGKNAFRFEA